MQSYHNTHDLCYTANKSVMVPHKRITNDDPTYVFVPLKGSSGTMAVFAPSRCEDGTMFDECIGWISVVDLGFNSVNEWMKETNWIDQGY